jgi:hypothetical protein
VAGSTKTLDRNVSGKMPMKPAFITAFGERISRPSTENTHDSPNEKTTTSASAATAPPNPPSGRYPRPRPTTMITVPATT